MKLSEAIRLGAMLAPQGFGMSRTLNRKGTMCALEAAGAAVGDDPNFPSTERFPILLSNSRPCPQRGEIKQFDLDLADSILHLNDDHRWTREQIADWVAAIEQPQESEAAVQQTVGA